VTFATYAVGMMALAGVPVFFSGFWSKDAILHAAHGWGPSAAPFYLGLLGALLTAFYMTRQVCYVFYGQARQQMFAGNVPGEHAPHESPAVMTLPLVILAVAAVILGFAGTPAWPWFQSFLGGELLRFNWEALFTRDSLLLMGGSALAVLVGIGLGAWLYGNRSSQPGELDPLERTRPDIYSLLERKLYVDEVYEATVVRGHDAWGRFCAWADAWVWNGLTQAAAYGALGLAWCSRFFDEYGLNLSFDRLCSGLRFGGGWTSGWQNGRIQFYLRFIAVGVVILGLLLIWGFRT